MNLIDRCLEFKHLVVAQEQFSIKVLALVALNLLHDVVLKVLELKSDLQLPQIGGKLLSLLAINVSGVHSLTLDFFVVFAFGDVPFQLKHCKCLLLLDGLSDGVPDKLRHDAVAPQAFLTKLHLEL